MSPSKFEPETESARLPSGLLRGEVHLLGHSKDWGTSFTLENGRLASICRDFEAGLEHVGSTAVPGLDSKPIIDLALGLPRMANLNELVLRLKDLQYEYHGSRRDSGGHIFDRLIGGRVRFLLHVVRRESFQWKMYLLVREYLQNSDAAKSRYSALKSALATRHPNNRKAYTQGKRAFMVGLKREALNWKRGGTARVFNV